MHPPYRTSPRSEGQEGSSPEVLHPRAAAWSSTTTDAETTDVHVQRRDMQLQRFEEGTSLPDVHIAGWLEAGSPSGFPLFSFYGLSGCRLNVQLLNDIGKRQGVRFIATDRLACSSRDYRSKSKVLHWPATVQSFARHLCLPQYGILGISRGGPLALACANAIPSSELACVGVLSCAAPWDAGRDDLPISARLSSLAVAWFPTFSTAIFDLALRVALRFCTSMPESRRLRVREGGARGLSAEEKTQIVSLSKFSEKWGDAMTVRRARRGRMLVKLLQRLANVMRTFLYEVSLLSQPYGFRLEDLPYNRTIRIWHGTTDRRSPIGIIRWMSERLPNCELTEYDGNTDMLVMERLEEIVVELKEQALLARDGEDRTGLEAMELRNELRSQWAWHRRLETARQEDALDERAFPQLFRRAMRERQYVQDEALDRSLPKAQGGLRAAVYHVGSHVRIAFPPAGLQMKPYLSERHVAHYCVEGGSLMIALRAWRSSSQACHGLSTDRCPNIAVPMQPLFPCRAVPVSAQTQMYEDRLRAQGFLLPHPYLLSSGQDH